MAPGRCWIGAYVSPVYGIVEHEVAVGERAALGVLAGEAHGDPVLEQGRVGERLALAPVDPALDDRLVAPLELLRELGVDREPGRHGQQLLVQDAAGGRPRPR